MFEATVKNDGVLFARTRGDGSLFPVYTDGTPMLWEPESFRIACELLAGRIKELKPDIVAGGLTGGAAIGAAVAVLSDVSYTLVRKEAKGYAQGRKVDGKVTKGDDVILIDDFFSSGSTAEMFVGFIEETGANVSRILTFGMLDEAVSGAWSEKTGVPVESIYSYGDHLEYAHARGKMTDDALELAQAALNDPYGWHEDPKYAERAKAFYAKHGSPIED